MYKVEMRVGIGNVPLVKIAQLKSRWDMRKGRKRHEETRGLRAIWRDLAVGGNG